MREQALDPIPLLLQPFLGALVGLEQLGRQLADLGSQLGQQPPRHVLLAFDGEAHPEAKLGVVLKE